MTVPEERPRGRSLKWWCAGWFKALFALAAIYAPLHWFASNYRLFYDSTKGEHCLPYSMFLVDIGDRAPVRGDYVAFVARGAGPYYKDGTLFVKLLAATPGDAVKVSGRGLWVNGRYWGGLLHVEPGGRLWRAGKRPADYRREERVPAHRLWVLGTHPRSYDSRYWGYVADEQVVGRAIPLW